MNVEGLCAAVQEAKRYLDQFNRREYRKAFQGYTERFGPLYMEAVRAAEPADVAAAILDGLEAGWRRQRFWNRSAVRVNEKQMMVDFLSPMLLGLEEPKCALLAEALREGWALRWPKDAYRITDYGTIQNGFRNAILGIDLANRHLEEGRD